MNKEEFKAEFAAMKERAEKKFGSEDLEVAHEMTKAFTETIIDMVNILLEKGQENDLPFKVAVAAVMTGMTSALAHTALAMKIPPEMVNSMIQRAFIAIEADKGE